MECPWTRLLVLEALTVQAYALHLAASRHARGRCLAQISRNIKDRGWTLDARRVAVRRDPQ